MFPERHDVLVLGGVQSARGIHDLAPGTHRAGGRGEDLALERGQLARPLRAGELRETAARMRAEIRVVEGDARDDHGTGFDRVLVDPPCSGLGTLRGHPDLRWRTNPERARELAGLQREILAAAERAVRPGGEVVYSTCTLNPSENEDVVALWKHDPVAPHLLLRPDVDGTDGFFIARLRRSG